MEPGSPLHQIVAASRFSLCTKSLAACALAHHKMNKKNSWGPTWGSQKFNFFTFWTHFG